MAVSTLLEKIAAIPVPKVKKIALAYSGGLDSSMCVHLAREKYGAEGLLAITVDVGQGEEELAEGLRKAKVLGLEPIVVDARREFAEEWLPRAIAANSSYGGYPVSTSMTRQLIARRVAEMAVEHGCDAVMEGSTGRGNDQYRMHNVFQLFAPGLKVLVPVRDFDLTRGEEEELCRAGGIPVTETMVGGDDKTLWCRSLASGAIGLDQPIPADSWQWLTPPEQAPEGGLAVELTFSRGVPVALDGQTLPLDTLIAKLNVVAGAHGIGRLDFFEDGIMGLKSREVYEAPAATVILRLHHDLEQFCLTKEELAFKRAVDQRWAELVYHGLWYHPLRPALDAFIQATQGVVNGTYTAKLYKGNLEIVARQSPTGLFFPEIRGIQSRSFNQQLCGPAAQILGLPLEVLAKRQQKMQQQTWEA